MQPSGPSSLIGALRYRGDELQLNRALTTVCQEPAVAEALVKALLEEATSHSVFGERARRILERVPPDLGCVEQERVLVRTGRGTGRAWTKRGDVDLAFANTAGDFHLRVELKIDAPVTRDSEHRHQIDRYVEAGLPVIAVARRRDAVDGPEERKEWLGTVTWSALLPRLAALPVKPSTLRRDWLALLAAAKADGDFDEVRPGSPVAVQTAAEWLEERRDLFLTHFANEVARAANNGAGRSAFSRAVSCGTTRTDARWAWLPIRCPPVRYQNLWVSVRALDAPAPAVAVEVVRERAGWRGRALKEAARRRLERADFVVRAGGDWQFVNSEPLVAADVRLRGRDPVVEEAIKTRLAAVARSGILVPHIQLFLRAQARN